VAVNWFRVAVGITKHPKVYALAAELKTTRFHACGVVLAILEWAATLDQEQVDLPVLTAAAILAEVACFVGSPRELVDALVRSGWLDLDQDRVRLHGWAELNGGCVRSSLGAKDRMQKLRDSRRETPERSANAQRSTHPPTHPPTNTVSIPTAQKTLSVVPAAPPAAPVRKAPRKVQAQAGEPQHQKLVEVWSAVYQAKTGQPYRYQQADFVQAALLHRQGVTPDEVAAAAERAFRPGIKEWLAVRSFKQLATRFAEVAVARSGSNQHNLATAAEIGAQFETREDDL
jgi:hypothetical protein